MLNRMENKYLRERRGNPFGYKANNSVKNEIREEA